VRGTLEKVDAVDISGLSGRSAPSESSTESTESTRSTPEHAADASCGARLTLRLLAPFPSSCQFPFCTTFFPQPWIL
jgi:hypothetical protein